MKFSQNFLEDGKATWTAITTDAYEMCNGSDEIAWELIIDSMGTKIFGTPESVDEIRKAITKHGWNEVLKHLAKEHPLL